MSVKKIGTKRDLQTFIAHAKRASAEVRGWPEWKKAFACDVYSVPLERFQSAGTHKKKKVANGTG
jgi:hypothetical protein